MLQEKLLEVCQCIIEIITSIEEAVDTCSNDIDDVTLAPRIREVLHQMYKFGFEVCIIYQYLDTFNLYNYKLQNIDIKSIDILLDKIYLYTFGHLKPKLLQSTERLHLLTSMNSYGIIFGNGVQSAHHIPHNITVSYNCSF